MSTVVPSALAKPLSVPLHEREFWSLRDASAATTLSVRKLQQMISAGALRAAKVGSRVILDPADVKAAIFGK